jgi:hypothetical protein
MILVSVPSEIEILERLLNESRAPLSPEAARIFLAAKFNNSDRAKMQRLAAKARAGTLTNRERLQAEAYERAGHLLAVLKSKARKAMKDAQAKGSA